MPPRHSEHRRALHLQSQRAGLNQLRLLLVATWHDTYDRLFGSEKVTAITDAWHSLSALARGLDRRGHLFLVAETDGAIVGTRLVREARQAHEGGGDPAPAVQDLVKTFSDALA